MVSPNVREGSGWSVFIHEAHRGRGLHHRAVFAPVASHVVGEAREVHSASPYLAAMTDSFRTEFELKGPPREVQNVELLDAALAAAAGGALEQVLHGIDPRRVLAFAHGGPPVWSVALCPCAGSEPAYLWVTYGLSSLIDPAAPFAHEMSIRVAVAPGAPPPQWPMFFLRSLARYQITSGRELKSGDVMPFPCSITRAAMSPEHRSSMPDSPLDAIAVIDDPTMQNVRRVVGLRAEEVELVKLWSVEGLASVLPPTLTTTVDRASYLADPGFASRIEAGSEREGSTTSAALAPGLRWREIDAGFEVTLPRGPHVPHLMRHIEARLNFGRPILLHDGEVGPNSELALAPADTDVARVTPRSPALLEVAASWEGLSGILAGFAAPGDPIVLRIP